MLGVTKPFEAKQAVTLPAELPPTTPYWLDAPPSPGRYEIRDPRADRRAREPAAAGGRLRVRDRGHAHFTVRRAVAYKWTDPVAGERYRPLEVDAGGVGAPGRERAAVHRRQAPSSGSPSS